MTEHHVEMFTESEYVGTGLEAWGWQCFTCRQERERFATLYEAERDATAHVDATRDLRNPMTNYGPENVA